MNWLERLNRGPGRIPLGKGTVEVLNWAYMAHLPDNVPHRHTYFEVCLVGTYGSGVFMVQGAEYPIQAGDLFIARPGVVHQIRNTATPWMELSWVSFQWIPSLDRDGEELDALLRGFADSSTLVVPDEENMLAVLWKAVQAVSSGPLRPGYETQVQSAIVSLLLAIAQAGAGPYAPVVPEPAEADTGVAVARLAVRYIHDNLYRSLSLPEIAAHCVVSPRHLCRLFLRFTGTSPAAYVNHARMDRARGLLLHTDTPIKEIAASVSYADVHYFTRLFAHHFGCPPGAFRRQHGSVAVPNVQKPGGLI